MTDELAEQLALLQRDDAYRVVEVLKESLFETTQKVMSRVADGAEQGPFVRKYIKRDQGVGAVYGRVRDAQQEGVLLNAVPRIIDCYHLGEDDVVVMDFIAGETLEDAVQRCGASQALAYDVFPRLCDAVLELHECLDTPIIHRDLKPSNIMISRDELTIIDLGIARLYKDDAATDTRHFGTRAYAPPEQFGFGQTTVRSDVYALGMLLYFCLTGETPTSDVREQGFFDGRIPAGVRSVLLKATRFDPADRYGDVRALKQAFVRACATGPRPAPASSQGFNGAPDAVVVEAPVDLHCSQGEARSFVTYEAVASAPTLQGEGAAKSSLASRGADALRKIPAPVGVAWNVAVTVCAFVLVAACAIATFSPNELDATYPLWFRMAEYLLWAAMSTVLLAYALLDKRRLSVRFKRLPRLAFWKLILIALAYLMITFVAAVIAYAAIV